MVDSNSIINSYDIISVIPTNEKMLQNLIDYDYYDILSFDVKEKLFPIKRN